MADLTALTVKELKELAQREAIPGFEKMKKEELISSLASIDPNDPLLPETEGNIFSFDEENNRWDLQHLPDEEEQDRVAHNPLIGDRTFEQKAVLHTDESFGGFSLSRAYNLERELPITDANIHRGAEARGQEVGDASGGKEFVLKDLPPEHPIEE